MTSDEVRAAFLSFFEGKGHKIIPSSSLIPKGDPTLLLTSAGMVQLKPYFLGEALPPSPRLASCQKCFRTTDIESVGDPSHLTFFEMLGNFSVGNYFKQETISWAWEFVTQHLKLPPQRLWITIFLDDEESFRCWQKLGVPPQKILRFGNGGEQELPGIIISVMMTNKIDKSIACRFLPVINLNPLLCHGEQPGTSYLSEGCSLADVKQHRLRVGYQGAGDSTDAIVEKDG